MREAGRKRKNGREEEIGEGYCLSGVKQQSENNRIYPQWRDHQEIIVLLYGSSGSVKEKHNKYNNNNILRFDE